MTSPWQEKFMSYALNLSRINIGQSAPNPCVGCVIVKDGKILSTGVTAKGGRPHAESQAIAKITDKNLLKEAEIYVTLEPCSHFGQTSPCVDEIIKYKFKKVIIGAIDPDSRVNGKAVKKLQDHKIEVISGVMQKECEEINRDFFKAKKTGLPFITAKIASSLDGKIATKNFDSKWITSNQAREFSHYLRSINDAILIGANTLRADNPTLDCRISGLENYSPKKIVIGSNLDFSLNLNIFKNSEKNLFLTKIGAKIPKNLQAEVIFCEELDGKIDLKDALKKLCDHGINSLLVEGGSKTITNFLKENLVDELIWIRNKKIIGNDGISAIGDMGFEEISQCLDNFGRKEIKEFPEDLVEVLKRF